MIRLVRMAARRQKKTVGSSSQVPPPGTSRPLHRSPGAAPGSEVIAVEHLEKMYGKLYAVDGISFSVRSGEVFSFLGPNGAGKSTTVEILEGLRPRTGGEVRVLGLDPWTELDRLKRRIGVIPQDFHFFPKLSPREAIRLYASLFGLRANVDKLLAEVELSDKADAYYDSLSGGQQQKVGVALSLVNDPEVCFLDEPTTGLDPRARRSIWEVIRRLKSEGRTIFLTTHYLEEAQQLADRIAIIDHGRIIATGAPDEIIARYGRPERLRIVGEAALAERLAASGLTVQRGNGAVEIELRSKAEALRILDAVASSGLEWKSFSTRSDTLEDVFIRLVGRLEDGTIHEEPSLPEGP